MIVISNSTPLIYLSTLSDFNVLRKLFGEITIPAAVYREVVIRGQEQPGEKEVKEAKGTWIRVVRVKDQKKICARLGQVLR